MRSGTDEEVRPPLTDEQADRAWTVVEQHAVVDGGCRECGTPGRCWTRAAAAERLILAGLPVRRPA